MEIMASEKGHTSWWPNDLVKISLKGGGKTFNAWAAQAGERSGNAGGEKSPTEKSGDQKVSRLQRNRKASIAAIPAAEFAA